MKNISYFVYLAFSLFSEFTEIEWGEEGPNRRGRRLLGLTFDHGLRALLAFARRTCRTHGRRGTFDLGATRARAGGALATILSTGGVVHNHRLRGRNRTLEDVLRKVGSGRAFGLQHIVRHFRACRIRRYRTLQHILTHIRVRGT
jgi:hypothetical protein